MPGEAPKPLTATSPGGGSRTATYPVADSHRARVNEGRTEEQGTVIGRIKRDIRLPTRIVFDSWIVSQIKNSETWDTEIHEQKNSLISSGWIRYVNETEIFAHAFHVNCWFQAVYLSCVSQNFRSFHVSNLSVRNLKGLSHLVQSCLSYRNCVSKDSARSTGHVGHFSKNIA